MTPPVKLDDLLEASMWIDAGHAAGVDCAAYVNLETGAVHWVGEGADDDDVPGELEEGSRYLEVPDRNELDLGQALAMRFIRQHLPESSERVESYFANEGAYGRLKAELDRAGKLEAWHAYEADAARSAIRAWAHENGLSVED